jgi:hypothetical protein
VAFPNLGEFLVPFLPIVDFSPPVENQVLFLLYGYVKLSVFVQDMVSEKCFAAISRLAVLELVSDEDREAFPRISQEFFDTFLSRSMFSVCAKFCISCQEPIV